MAKNTDTLVAFLFGALAGGVTALLLAPDKGEVTRRKIRDKSSDLYTKGHESWDRGVETVEEKAHEYGQLAKEKAHEAGEYAREKSQKVTSTAKNQVEAVKGALAEGKEAYKRELDRG